MVKTTTIKKLSYRKRDKGSSNTAFDETNAVDVRLYSARSRNNWAKKVRALCCWVCGSNNRSRTKALENIAHSMATMFDGVDIALPDFVAALMLVDCNQKKVLQNNRTQNTDCNDIDILAVKMRNVNFIPCSGQYTIPSIYFCEAPSCV